MLVYQFVNGKYPFYPIVDAKLTTHELLAFPETERGKMHFDQPELAITLLNSLKQFNEPLLTETFSQVQLDFPEGTIVSKPKLSFLEALQVGLENPPIATTVFMILFHYLASVQERVPFVLLMDGINFLYGNTQYRDTNGQLMTSARFPLIHLLRKYFEESGSPLHPVDNQTSIKSRGSCLPLVSDQFKVIASMATQEFSELCMTAAQLKVQIQDELPMLSSRHEDRISFHPNVHTMSYLSRQEVLRLLKYYRSIGLIYEGMYALHV